MNSPPAFPSVFDHERGMSLRDYFAAKAMQTEMLKWKDGHEDGFEGIAELCYFMADAMLAAREKT